MAEIAPPSQPSWSELDILAVVWEAFAEGDVQAARLSEIHKRLTNRRAGKNEPEPAITTVSTQLRSLVDKRLLEVVIVSPTGEVGGTARGMTRPPSRSPLTGYRPVHKPGDVLAQTFKDLASAYPDQSRYQVLLDFARALDLPRGTLKKLEKLMKDEKLIKED